MSTNQQQGQETALALVKKELPTLKAILALNSRPGTDIETIAIQELEYLQQLTVSKPDILECQPLSVLLAIKSVMRKNLTLDPSAGLIYVKTRKVNTGTYQSPNWVKVIEITESPNGIISVNRQLGRALDYTNPQIQKDTTGKVIGVSMQILKPSHKDPRWELYEYDESDFLRWRQYSHKENSKNYKQGDNRPAPNAETLNYANKLYTSWKGGIDPEFARAKCIKHSFKKLGTNLNEENKIKLFERTRDTVIDPHSEAFGAMADDEQAGFVSHEEVSSNINNEFNQPDGDINTFKQSNNNDMPTSDEL